MDRITAPRTFSVSSIVASRSETPDAFLQSKSLQSIHLSGYRKPSKGDTAIDKRLLRVDEAATLLNISRGTIYRWVHDGRLEATKLTTGPLKASKSCMA